MINQINTYTNVQQTYMTKFGISLLGTTLETTVRARLGYINLLFTARLFSTNQSGIFHI